MGSSDDLVAKLRGGSASNYDVISPSSDVATSISRTGLAEPLDLSRIPTYTQLSARLRDLPLVKANGQTFGVPFMWGPNPLLYNTTAFAKPPDSWSLFWDPKYKGKISVWDDLSTLYMAAQLLGYDQPDPSHLYNLSDDELAAVVRRFEEISHDIVTSEGGRVVKMIGDEVMFVVDSITEAAHIGLALADAYSDDDLLSDVRVGLACGPVLLRDGDYFGPTVNLAHRIVNIANPGTVLMSDDFQAALQLDAPEQFSARPLRPRVLKDLGRVQLWWLSRPGEEADGAGAAADRRRNVRWERLSEVLRDLEELRGVGERLLTSKSGDSVSLQPGGGDPVGS